MQCHGEYGDLAGWVVPVSKLISQGLAENTGSDIDIVQNYFRASCAPSNSPKEGEICTACASPVRSTLETSDVVVQVYHYVPKHFFYYLLQYLPSTRTT